MKKLASLFAGALILTACGGPNLPSGMPTRQMMQPSMAAPTQVSSQSILGINKELKKSVEANFAAKDANQDGFITPDEFPVKSPEDFNYFRRLDISHDGRIQMNEMSDGILGRVTDILQLKATAAFIFDELDKDNNGRLSKSEVGACKVPGVAANFDAYLGKSWITGKRYDSLRKSDFENLLAFAMTNPAAASGLAAEQIPDEVIAD